ncbi:hypothetical protein [Rhizobium sp. SG741]|uniref:lysozyme inhibitor LprI family protein n=1 Tax=Rhizobium sp. SG741 TaxID=2587114 RepID=UPI001447C2E6|nr:hypothetical protein [Rhizobium sp. SG741]NKJ08996.1 uncharacterized protein [Rhizobium sp. SG741]
MKPISYVLLAATFGFFAFTCPDAAKSGGFDCRKAVSADERAICSNDELSALDDAMAAGFRQAKKSSPSAVKSLSRSLLAERNACGGDVECLKSAMTKAIGAYKSVILGEPVDANGQDKNKIYDGTVPRCRSPFPRGRA